MKDERSLQGSVEEGVSGSKKRKKRKKKYEGCIDYGRSCLLRKAPTIDNGKLSSFKSGFLRI